MFLDEWEIMNWKQNHKIYRGFYSVNLLGSHNVISIAQIDMDFHYNRNSQAWCQNSYTVKQCRFSKLHKVTIGEMGNRTNQYNKNIDVCLFVP
jgi:hypothetical protein